MSAGPRISLGPVPYFWQRETLDRFYASVADWPVERVCVGETVCSKRRAYRPRDWISLARELTQAGKEVALSSLTLIESRSEVATLRRLCREGLPIEANDYTAVSLAESHGLPFIGGVALNLYNRPAIDALTAAGMRTWMPPLDLPGEALGHLLGADRPPVEVELFAFGRMPLAWSARCFTARAHGRSKDDCGFICQDHADGLDTRTQDDADFLVINGVQTQSARCLDLLPHLDAIRSLGIDTVRVSPQSRHTDAIVRRWAEAIAGDAPASVPADWLVAPRADGYWTGAAGRVAVG